MKRAIFFFFRSVLEVSSAKKNEKRELDMALRSPGTNFFDFFFRLAQVKNPVRIAFVFSPKESLARYYFFLNGSFLEKKKKIPI